MRQSLIHALLAGFLFTYGAQALAWQVTLQPGKDGLEEQITVSNDRELCKKGLEGQKASQADPKQCDMDVYLVWFDLDGNEGKQAKFVSFLWDQQKWQEGESIMPATSKPLYVPKFEALTVPSPKQSCPDKHRCFLALVATASKNPIDDKEWQAASILPLNLTAGRERLPGQQFFLPPESAVNRYGATGMTTTTEGAAPAVADKATAPTAAAPTASGQPTTEKPDIFSLVGTQLLYANGQAQRFQIIDVADPSKPRLAGWTKLAGAPRELYVRDPYYVLLQTDYSSGETGTHLTVLSNGADGKFTTVQDLPLSGSLLESRRRGDFIYTVTSDYQPIPSSADCQEYCGNQSVVVVHAIQMQRTGQLVEVDKAQLSGYSPNIAIFTDHLVVANNDPTNWIDTQISIFDLSQADGKLVALPTLKVPGRVPSEFHLDISNQQFRVVYGPEDRQKGSTLAIYDLLSPKLDLLGKVSDIAPGEDLFATRFVNNRAFVVTYVRTDPLWVIDLTDATAPKVIGELHVPGWSEKLFFHEDRLFAVGTDDQPAEGEAKDKWVRRVAMSLFDVADPTKPLLLSKLTPLAGQVSYSSSPAIDDERALLLNWDNALAALPIESWEAESGSYLQIVSLANNKLDDVGLVPSPISLQRSLPIQPDILAALGDQALLTVRWGIGTKPQVLAELELANNLLWLKLKEGDLWAATYGNKGYHRLYRYKPTDTENPVRHWSLPRGYGGLIMDGNLAVFYDGYSPLAVQVLDVSTGQLSKAHELEKSQDEQPQPVSPAEGVAATDIMPPVWYDRSQPLVHDGWFYVAEQRPFQPETSKETAYLMPPANPDKQAQPEVQWLLRSWNLKTEEVTEAATRSIPGKPVAFTAKGELITQESTGGEKSQLRLNLLSLEEGKARLLTSRQLTCRDYSQLMWTEETLYVKCETQDRYWGPIYYAARADEPVATGTETTTPATDTQTPPEPTTQLLKLSPAQEFAEVGQWTFKGTHTLQAVSPEVVLLGPEYYWYGPMLDGGPMVRAAEARGGIMPPRYESGCDIYHLIPAQEPVLLKHLETCPASSMEGTVLTTTKAWTAEGFAGIREISW
jgi:hypothetical protein